MNFAKKWIYVVTCLCISVSFIFNHSMGKSDSLLDEPFQPIGIDDDFLHRTEPMRRDEVPLQIPVGDKPQPFLNETRCSEVPNLIKNASHPYEINEIRRNLGLLDPECLVEHIHLFSESFIRRLKDVRKHLSLHIPKTGGTSLCKAAKDHDNFTTVGGNCWTKDFCPLWCGCEEPKTMMCDDLSKIKVDFVMNENWLDDLCDDRLYSMLIREPVSRAMSHVNHFLDAVAARGHKHFHNTKGWRLSLIQSNYMTWSLTAGQFSNIHPKYFRPTKEHIDYAKKTLSRMDFVVDLNYPNKACNNIILNLIGISPSTIGKSNSYGNKYRKQFRQADYELLNELDMELYTYANKIIEIDCIFFDTLITKWKGS